MYSNMGSFSRDYLALGVTTSRTTGSVVRMPTGNQKMMMPAA